MRTFREAFAEFHATPQNQDLARETKRIYERAFGELTLISEADFDSLTSTEVRAAVAHLSDRPGLYNQALSTGSAMVSAVGTGDANPFTRIRKMKLGERKAWTDRELTRFVAGCDTGIVEPDVSMLFHLGLHTGQRVGDLMELRWSDFTDNFSWLSLSQNKTGMEVTIPVHSRLKAVIEKHVRSMEAIPIGRVVTAKHTTLMAHFRKAMTACDVRDRTFHGLRKTAARLMAEAGCTEREIMSITGHKSTAMASYYTRQADRTRMAASAMKKLEAA